MDRYIGKLLDNRYEILERVGTGGMAVVYKGRDHRLNRLVAIKILKEDLAQDADIVRRFHDESQAVAMLSHPNIMAVYDVSRWGNVDYIVMELLDGITLKQYMQRKGGKLNWKEALHFITQIMKALSHAHSRGIIHRDIKPHNIMVLRDGSIKVADFGIARVTSSNQNTMTQEALGSVHYISPEQARGSHIDARSDIYSAGVVLYEMLTGRLPYEGDSPVAVAIQHINSVPLSPRELERDIPEALEAITIKAMASDVNKRYISADAMLADLEAFRKNPNISFEVPSPDLASGEDEPTQIIGANAPSAITQGGRRPVPGSRMGEATQRIPRPTASQSQRQESYSRTQIDERQAPQREPEEPHNPWPIVGAVAVILLFLVGIGYFLYTALYGSWSNTTEEITVPSVLGYTVEEAKALPEVLNGNFRIVEGEQQSSAEEVGKIAAQSPDANTKVANTEGNRTITVHVSKGLDSPEMPDLYDKEINLAKHTLEQLNLNLDIQVEEENHDEITSEHVIRQDPQANTPLTEGQTVTLYVSLGPKQTTVTLIPFIGQSYDSAYQWLSGEGLKVVRKDVFDDSVENGIVIDQSIPGGTEVSEGASITLTVSNGPEPEPTPSPTVEPSPSPTPPEHTPEQPAQVTRTLSISLPTDREWVDVRIEVNGINVYEATLETSAKVMMHDITYTPPAEVRVYLDNQPVIDEVYED